MELERVSKGLGREITAEELAFVEGETAECLANGIVDNVQQNGDYGYTLDCMIVSARVYLDQAERLREIYLNGLH